MFFYSEQSVFETAIYQDWVSFSSSLESPSWLGATVNQDTRDNFFYLYSSSMDTIRSSVTSSDTYDVSANYPNVSTYVGGVLMKDGRVFMIPAQATVGSIYDPSTNTVSVPSGTFPGQYAFSHGCLMKDGRIYLAPYNSTTARIYDPETNTLTTPSGTFPGAYKHYGATLMKDGRVFISTRIAGNSAKIYDPETNTLSNANCTSLGKALLMKSGKIFIMSSWNGGQAGIYDPETDTTTLTSGSFPASLIEPVNMYDGRIYISPMNSATARIYDPETDTISTPSGTFPVGTVSGYNAFSGAVAMADGRIMIIPYHNQYARIYDPITDTLSTTAAGYGTLAWASGVLLKNNKVLFVKFSASRPIIYSARVTDLADTFTLSSFINS